jgi:hypothetical protein
MTSVASLTLTGLLSGMALAAQAGVGEPAYFIPVNGIVRPSTALDDESVRPLDRSRKPQPAIEQDIVLPEPRPPRQSRNADDELVLPGGPGFRPERALDDAFALPPRAAPVRRTFDNAPSVRVPRFPEAPKAVAEDPAGRASEAGKPSRKGRAER